MTSQEKINANRLRKNRLNKFDKKRGKKNTTFTLKKAEVKMTNERYDEFVKHILEQRSGIDYDGSSAWEDADDAILSCQLFEISKRAGIGTMLDSLWNAHREIIFAYQDGKKPDFKRMSKVLDEIRYDWVI